ncbi:hypothetical protein [Ralstonia solanacearum]|uniref:hypothetical protein n=1 Tax=Ralstonia solanacearum TaxID=305 RepID=UPI000A11E387|nr:hypothetical protein [Ralstonia solanacearum]
MKKNELLIQDTIFGGLFYGGQAPNWKTGGLKINHPFNNLDLLVVMDRYPWATAGMATMPAAEATPPNRNGAFSLLPAVRHLKTSGWSTASNLWLQCRKRLMEPFLDWQPDQFFIQPLADGLGLAKDLWKQFKFTESKGAAMPCRDPKTDWFLGEFTGSNWTLGSTGHSRELLQALMRTIPFLEVPTFRSKGAKDPFPGYALPGDYFALRWPCYATRELNHPGTATL